MLRFIFIVWGILYIHFLTHGAAKHQDILNDLYHKCLSSAEKFDYNNEYKYSQELLKLSRESKDKNYEARALIFYGTSKLFTGRSENAKQDLLNGLNLSKELNNDSLIALTYNSLAIYEGMVNSNLNISQNYLLQARDYALKSNYETLIASIYNNLSEIARKQEDPSGVNYALLQYRQGEKDRNPRMVFLGADNLAYFYYLSKDLDKAREYIKIAKTIQKNNGYAHNGNLNFTAALIDIESGHLKNAETNAQLFIKDSKTLATEDQAEALILLAKIKNLQGLNNQSNQLLSEVAKLINGYDLKNIEEKIERLKASNFEALGESMYALNALTKADSLANVVNSLEKQHLINERSMMLEIYDHENNAKVLNLQTKHQRYIIWSLSIGAVILVLFFIFMIFSIRKRNFLYRHIVSNYKEILNFEKESRQSKSIERDLDEASGKDFKSETENEKPAKSNFLDTEKSKKIYTELCELLENERLYMDPNFTREELVERLHTNRTYLSQIIKIHTGKNYSQLINSYRIKEAIKVLSDPQKKDYSLKKISDELGFVSSNTFSKVFQQTVGMSPSNFRKTSFEQAG